MTSPSGGVARDRRPAGLLPGPVLRVPGRRPPRASYSSTGRERRSTPTSVTPAEVILMRTGHVVVLEQLPQHRFALRFDRRTQRLLCLLGREGVGDLHVHVLLGGPVLHLPAVDRPGHPAGRGSGSVPLRSPAQPIIAGEDRRRRAPQPTAGWPETAPVGWTCAQRPGGHTSGRGCAAGAIRLRPVTASSESALALFARRIVLLGLVVVGLLAAGAVALALTEHVGVWYAFRWSLDTAATVGVLPGAAHDRRPGDPRRPDRGGRGYALLRACDRGGVLRRRTPGRGAGGQALSRG